MLKEIWMSVNKLFLRSINKDAHLAHRADSRLAPNQWETSLQSNAVSHWLGANLESALSTHFLQCPVKNIILTLPLWTYIEYTAWGWEQLYKQRCGGWVEAASSGRWSQQTNLTSQHGDASDIADPLCGKPPLVIGVTGGFPTQRASQSELW